MADEKQNPQKDYTAVHCHVQKSPKFDLVFSLMALTLILFVALCFFILGLGLEPFAQWAFLALPIFFLFAMPVVPVSLLYGAWQVFNHNERYTKGQRFRRKFLLLTILLLSLSYPIWCTCLPVYGVRTHVAITGGVDEMQKWAIHILDMPIDEVYDKEAAKNGMHIIRKELYSPQMREISHGWVSIVTDENEEPYLNITLAGGFFPGWGIRMGRPGFRPAHDGDIWYSRWADGVYGFACH